MKQLADEVVGFVRTFLFLHRFLFLYFSSSVPLFYANTRYWYFFLNSSSITNQKTVVPGCSVIKKARSIPHVNNKSDCFGFVKVGLLITFSTCRLSRRFADFALSSHISKQILCLNMVKFIVHLLLTYRRSPCLLEITGRFTSLLP